MYFNDNEKENFVVHFNGLNVVFVVAVIYRGFLEKLRLNLEVLLD